MSGWSIDRAYSNSSSHGATCKLQLNFITDNYLRGVVDKFRNIIVNGHLALPVFLRYHWSISFSWQFYLSVNHYITTFLPHLNQIILFANHARSTTFQELRNLSMASKWKGSYDSARKYKKSWETKYVWLTQSLDGKGNAYCKLCRKTLQPKLWSISKHESSEEHSSKVRESQQMRPLILEKRPKPGTRDEIKKAELQVAVGIACHSAIMAVDHLGEIMVQHGKGSTIGDIQLHRTKCSQLLTKVISPAIKFELQVDVKDKGFAVLIDETTDVAAKKNLCICIRYFSESSATIETAYVDMVEVVDATGESLFQAMKSALENIGLNIEQCFGFASDGASTMMGERNSVWSRMQAASPNCTKMKCICHSLALCTQHAFEKLPSNLGFHLKEIPKWFSKSVTRRESFKQLLSVMDPNEEGAAKPLPFQKMSATRWLVRGKVIYNILVNWEEIKAYFMVEEPSMKSDMRYKARMILSMLNDQINYLYFHFLSPVVTEFERVNAFFQSTNADPEEMVQLLFRLHQSLRDRIHEFRSNNLLPTSRIDFGVKFLMEMKKYSADQGDSELAKANVKELLVRCKSYLVELLSQVEKRLPDNEKVFDGLRLLSPKTILSQLDRPLLVSLPMLHIAGDLRAVEEQYRQILHVDWASQDVFGGAIPSDAIDFWAGVYRYETASGKKTFKELSIYALTALATPLSNAICERVFSQLTCVKTKLRNRMSLEMLDALIRIRATLKNKGKCCTEFQVTSKMLELFNSVTMRQETSTDTEQIIISEYL